MITTETFKVYDVDQSYKNRNLTNPCLVNKHFTNETNINQQMTLEISNLCPLNPSKQN